MWGIQHSAPTMAQMYFLALTAVLLAAPCAGRQPALRPLVEPIPTMHRATRGQDAQRCGTIALPELLNLAPKVNNGLYKSGIWNNKDGATLVSWWQDLFAFSYDTVDFYVDAKLLLRARAIRDPQMELEAFGVDLVDEKSNNIVVILKDCDDVPMYFVKELTNGECEIFDHWGELIARGTHGETIADQIYFKDDAGDPIAVAQSPIITMSEEEKTQESYRQPDDLDTWQVWFPSMFSSRSSLRDPILRYVIAAVVQERAVRKAMSIPGTNSQVMPSSRVFVVLFLVVLSAGFLALCVVACSCTFHLVYPLRKPKDPTENPFLTDIRNPYNTMDILGQVKNS
mmetsp:Transcript_24429/g.42749  ORF Transcript_24429/g.42749 Transcript_24429/m.42749 type:complete len:341 (+) Transcript_24429:102-1124(+)